MQRVEFVDFFNLSNSLNSVEEFQEMSGFHQVVTGVVTLASGIFFIYPGVVAFRGLTHCFTKVENKTDDSLSMQAESIDHISTKAKIKKEKHSITIETTPKSLEEARDSGVFFQQLRDQTTPLETLYEKNKVLKLAKTTHRFSDIPCPKKTAVKIEDSYLHANWVKMPDHHTYIAAQAPAEEEKFWKGALQYHYLIVDLTTPRDLERGVQCYYPEEVGEEKKCGEISVTLDTVEERSEAILLCQYTVSSKKSSHSIERIHFNQWPDTQGADLELLLPVLAIIDSWMAVHPDQPILIHCRAGVGRTGTLIALLTLKHLIETDKLKDRLYEAIEMIILQGRESRGPAFVQTKQQLEMILHYCSEVLKMESLTTHST